MSDTTDCDADSSGSTSRGRGAFGVGLDDGRADDADVRLHSHVERYDDAPDECTIYPRTASAEFPRTTTWLTAQEGSYLSLEDAR